MINLNELNKDKEYVIQNTETSSLRILSFAGNLEIVVENEFGEWDLPSWALNALDFELIGEL